MSKEQKLLHKFQQNPQQLSYQEIEKVLLYLGAQKMPLVRGSHVKFRFPGLPRPLIISKHGKDCSDDQKRFTLKTLKFYNIL